MTSITDQKYVGDNKLITPKSSIDGVVCYLDIDSSHLGVEEGLKGIWWNNNDLMIIKYKRID